MYLQMRELDDDTCTTLPTAHGVDHAPHPCSQQRQCTNDMVMGMSRQFLIMMGSHVPPCLNIKISRHARRGKKSQHHIYNASRIYSTLGAAIPAATIRRRQYMVYSLIWSSIMVYLQRAHKHIIIRITTLTLIGIPHTLCFNPHLRQELAAFSPKVMPQTCIALSPLILNGPPFLC